MRAISLIVALIFFCQTGPLSAAPTLYAQPAYQSPVRGVPDDLLLIPGYGFTHDDIVVYQALTDTTRAPVAPVSAPEESTATTGIAPVVSVAGVPYSLTVRLPTVMQSDQSYVLWVLSDGTWSEGIKINDARPLWITPTYVYATQATGALQRYVKVVGRNLQPAAGADTRIRLTGPRTITLIANREPGAIVHYVARADLPAQLQPGEYRVQVSRDDVSWVDLENQTLTVRADPAAHADFALADFGCRPDDGTDDVRCIAAAIKAAAAAGGGQIVFGAGTWDMIDSAVGEVTPDGILVPPGVSLVGASAATTTVLRHSAWSRRNASHNMRSPPNFTLQGRNTVQRLKFKDQSIYSPQDIAIVSGILQLGRFYYRAAAGDPAAVADIVITQNIFDRPMTAIGTGGQPIERLVVTGNEFGAYKEAVNLGGHRLNVNQLYHVDDSIVTHNVFRPGSYIDDAIQQGSIASHVGAARRLDFSNNIADGSSTEYLQDPQRDAHGWRAAFFWHMNNSHEMMLVAQNTATCAGDKAGDGEAIAYDNDANTFAFSGARTVLAATADTVTAAGPLKARQETVAVNLQNYYLDHWIRVVDGPGVGQVRRIDSYTAAPDAASIAFSISPSWDVAPTKASRISVAREYWQVYTVDNLIDHRQPLCRKSNVNAPEGGKITLYAEFADSAVEGNRQYDTDGITVHQSYNAEDPSCPKCKTTSCFQSFVEVRGNIIEGEYDWMSDCSQSGILVSHSAAPTPASPSPVVGYGLSISHNSLNRTDGVRGGAITFPITWLKGPPPYDWKLMDGTLVHHNRISGLDGNVPFARCDHKQSRRIGINLYEESLAWNTVLYANSCSRTSLPLVNRGRKTILVCPSPAENSCECRPAPKAPTIRATATAD